MIDISGSYGIETKKDVGNLKYVTHPIQLGLYKVQNYIDYEREIIDIILENNVQVQVVHLPIDLHLYDSIQTLNAMRLFELELGCEKFVIHPNKGIKGFIEEFIDTKMDVELCIENFQWVRRKTFRSPLEIYDICQLDDRLKITLDTSHSEEIWFDHKVLKYFLPKVSVIHLSNRIGKSQHKPFNVHGGDLNLVKFVKELGSERFYDWSGDIVLEYMSEFSHKLLPNMAYIEKFLNQEEK